MWRGRSGFVRMHFNMVVVRIEHDNMRWNCGGNWAKICLKWFEYACLILFDIPLPMMRGERSPH
jgi:hypothetical protein